MSVNNVERVISGVRCMCKKKKYWFAKNDVFRRFGYTDRKLFDGLCPEADSSVKFSNGDIGIPFEEVVTLAEHSKKPLQDFVDALQEEIDTSKRSMPKPANSNHPDFFNDPAGAARAWAEQYDRIADLEKQLEDAKEKLGDGSEFKMVRKIAWLPEYFNMGRMYLCTAIGNRLWRMSQKLDAPIKKCVAFGYCESSTRNMYSVKVIDLLRHALDQDEELMKSYRHKNTRAKISEAANG